jgi:polyisoprenoid-binding protein YceI
VEGTYGIQGGSVTLTPEDGQLRIRAYLEIDTPSVTVGSAVIDEALRLGMETDAYPVAIFDATSTELVPVTEEEVFFTLDGTLTLHGQTRPVRMSVGPATVIRNHLESASQMTFNLTDFGISLPEAVVSATIALDVHLSAALTPPPPPTPPGEPAGRPA